MALLAGAAVFALVWLTGGVAPRRQRETYRTRERAARLERLLVDALAQEQLAKSNAKKALEARLRARGIARKVQKCEWDAVFYAAQKWARHMGDNVPRLQGYMANELRNASIFDRAAQEHLAKAATARKALAKATPKVRQQAGLVVLAHVCFQGWVARSGK